MPGGIRPFTAARHREAYFPQENVLDCDLSAALVNHKITDFMDLRLPRSSRDEVTEKRFKREKGKANPPSLTCP
jgi:hypothetical protein